MKVGVIVRLKYPSTTVTENRGFLGGLFWGIFHTFSARSAGKVFRGYFHPAWPATFFARLNRHFCDSGNYEQIPSEPSPRLNRHFCDPPKIQRSARLNRQ